MGNLKHAIAALMAVVMVGSLAVKQATDMAPASANRLTGETPKAVNNITQADWSLDLPTRDEELIDPVKDIDDLIFRPFTAYVLSKDGAAVWTAPEQKESLATLSCGEQITIIDEMATWYVVEYQDQEAYIPKDVLTDDYEQAKQVLLEYYMFETGKVSTDSDSLNVRSGASTEGTQIIDQADNGDMIVILEQVGDGWVKVFYGKDYQTGYVKAEYIEIEGMTSKTAVYEARSSRLDAIAKPATVTSNGKTVDILYMPTSDADVIGTLKDGMRCSVLEKGSTWTKVVFGEDKNVGYVKSSVILTDAEKAQKEAEKKREAERKAAKAAAAQSSDTAGNTVGSASGQAIVEEAKKYLGVPYVYGGTSPSGFDCSGLVQYVCRKVGISVNRTSRSQYSNGVAVSKSNLQPGDLVFFSRGGSISHVGIYAGGGQVIHAPRTGKNVSYISLDNISSYSTYVGARRVA